MCDLHTAAEELRRIEAKVMREFAKIAPPIARDARPESDPKPSPTVENVAIAVGVIAVLAGLFLT
jgi:hypothetical protein